ncbi:MAG: DNA polymerase III subunit gamma/tau [Clostridia bacterium]|nr:DNA polymerase III subunit gamma/tau [Clostridia bacterium]
MYRVLYRKWRPTFFSDVIGQSHVTSTLKNEIRSGRISHAYLFTGSRGTGKTTCAKILARAVNCLDPQDGEPCGKCDNCVGIASGSIMDVVEMDAASNNSVNNIREVLDEVVFTPGEAKYRVYIIDEVHMLTTGAFNALLKTLEEPPAHIVFILATTEVHKIPATILSRCQRFDFNRITPEIIAERLEYISKEENVSITHDAAMLIAAVADGAMRDALSLLDRCIGLADNITAEIVREAAGLAGRDYLFTLADAVIDNDIPLAITTVNTLHTASKSMSRLCEELTEHFRTLMLIRTMKKKAEGLLLLSENELEKAYEQANRISLVQTVSCIDILTASLEKMFKGGNNKIEFETCMIKLCSPELSDDLSSVRARLDKLEQEIKLGYRRIDAPQNDNNTGNTEKSQQQSTSSKGTANDAGKKQSTVISGTAQAVQANKASAEERLAELARNAKPLANWEDVLDAMKARSTVLYHRMTGTNAYISGDYVLIEAKDDTPFEFLRSDPARNTIVKDTIKNVLGRTYAIGPYRRSARPVEEQKKNKLDEFIEKISNSNIKLTVED